MSIRKKVPKKTIEQLIDFNSSRYYSEFNLVQFQRKYRKFYKFSIISDKLFFMTSKITLHSLKVENLRENRFICTYTGYNSSWEFTALSGREFIEKIVKHNIY